MRSFVLSLLAHYVVGFGFDNINLAADYYFYKDAERVSYLSCDNQYRNKLLARTFIARNIMLSVKQIDNNVPTHLDNLLHQWDVAIGVLLDGDCENTQQVLDTATTSNVFDAMHYWLILTATDDTKVFINQKLEDQNLSVDSDIVVASKNDTSSSYDLADVYNFGKIQGNGLEISPLGTWRRGDGLNISHGGFKYYNRWDFHNLTLRAISVILDQPEAFYPEMLCETKYTPGVAAMTKMASQLLNILSEQHNFRFNYTIASRWIGSPEKNSTLAVSNSLYWKEQDLSSTTARIFPHWLDWVDIYFPPVTHLETKFYYLIPDKGVGDYENRFLTPMSPGVWWCASATGVICALVLAGAASMERRPDPGLYAFFSVFATTCQQDFEDGVQIPEKTFSSQGRRGTLLVVGLTSMLLYNYYTSSVVSWLLNAAAPSIASLDALINSDIELIFEDIGYTRGWLDNPGFFYYSGFKNVKEDELREKKVTNANRKLKPLQSVETGVDLVRTGRFAYHTEPFTASQVISKTYQERELCELGALPMMLPAHVYIYGQKRSPFKQFFVWSLMRLQERGHFRASQARFAGAAPACSGRRPRALALGQAAPAFALLAEAALLSAFMMLVERAWYKYQLKRVAAKSRQTREPGSSVVLQSIIRDRAHEPPLYNRAEHKKTIKGRRLTRCEVRPQRNNEQQRKN